MEITKKEKKLARKLTKKAMKLSKSPRMTVDFLMEKYTKPELMKIFRFHMINKQHVLTKEEITEILALPDDDPKVHRSEMMKPKKPKLCDGEGRKGECIDCECILKEST